MINISNFEKIGPGIQNYKGGYILRHKGDFIRIFSFLFKINKVD
jgi:hypothetical protein